MGVVAADSSSSCRIKLNKQVSTSGKVGGSGVRVRQDFGGGERGARRKAKGGVG